MAALNIAFVKTPRAIAAALLTLGAFAFVQNGGTRGQAAHADTSDFTLLNQPAPELVGADSINTPGGQPLRLANLKGKVTILHFWTFGCINCKHNLPAYAHWQREFAGKNVALVSVHTPETSEERVAANVRANVRRQGITYPVLIDSKGTNWNNWQQRYWPTVYLIDKHGRVRYRWEGELQYNGQDGTREVAYEVNDLLKEK